MTSGVVVEVREHMQPFAHTIGEPVRPIIQSLVGIPATVLVGAEVESNVHERTDDHLTAR